MTVNSTCPPPPTVPATTRPGVDADPDAQAAVVALVHGGRDLDRRCDGAVGVRDDRLGRAEDAEQPVADVLVRVAAMAHEQRHDELVELVETVDDLACARALGEAREVADVEAQDRDLQFLAVEVDAVAQHHLGDARADVGAERLVQPLALLQAGDHVVERAREAAGLVGRDDRHARAQVAAAHALGRFTQRVERPEDRARQQDRQLERDREGDDDRDDDGRARGPTAARR